MNKLKRILQKYDVISFDIFDTLLKRDVGDISDIFLWTSREYERIYGEKISNYKTIRVNAQENAAKRFGHKCYNYDNIYELMEGVSEQQKERLKKLELEIENMFLQVYEPIKLIYDWCIQNKKKVYLVSDMYMSSKNLTVILKNKNIDGYEAIYVSSEYGENKSDGKLFKIMLRNEKISEKNVLHIGNSRKSDVLGANIAGIRAVWIQSFHNNMNYFVDRTDNFTLDMDCFWNILNNALAGNITDTRAERIGFEVVGPIIFGFNQWLHSGLKENEKIVFLSRDMHLFYKAYNRMYYKETNNISYVYLSRKALLPAVLYYSEDYCIVLRQWYDENKSIKEILKLLHLKQGRYDNLLAQYNLYKENILDLKDDLAWCKFGEFLANIKFDIKKANEKEALNTLGYLRQCFKGNHIALVDLGWRSTIQVYLQMLIDLQLLPCVQLTGYYIGTYGPKVNYKIKEKGYLYDKQHLKFDLKSGTFLLECLCLELCGSVKGYEHVNGCWVAVKTQNYQSNYNFVKEVHQGSLKFIEYISKRKVINYLHLKPSFCFSGYRHLLNSPRAWERKELRKVNFDDHDKLVCILDNKSLVYYIFHPNVFLADLLSAKWKAGFLKDILKFDMPYHELYYTIVGWIRKADKG